MSKTVLLIDGDQYLYRACAACESETRWDDENHVLASNAQEAWDTVQGSLKKVFDHFGTKEHVLAFGKGENFRKKVDPSYKMNRAGQRKPLCFAEVKQWMLDAYNVVSFDGLEADDVMGILSTKPAAQQAYDRIIVANDKDMKTIPGKLWDGWKFSVITEAQADYWHLYQTLVGDSADGYKGCPGVGPKKATALLDPPFKPELLQEVRVAALWPVVVEAYVKAGLTADDALRQARLARQRALAVLRRVPLEIRPDRHRDDARHPGGQSSRAVYSGRRPRDERSEQRAYPRMPGSLRLYCAAGNLPVGNVEVCGRAAARCTSLSAGSVRDEASTSRRR